MQELFPLAAGTLIGLAMQRVRNPRLRTLVLVVMCLIIGVLASFLSGELATTPAFISFDTVLVWVGALMAVIAAALWRRRISATR